MFAPQADDVKVRLVIVGRDRKDPLVAAADDYLRRVERSVPTEVVELKEVPLRRNSAPEEVMAVEAERIRKVIGPRDRVVALDKSGRSFGSEVLAEKLDSYMQGGLSALTCVIGGPSGLDAAWLATVHERWSLSPMTLPHRIARLVLCEQLYRGFSILRGEPYHK